MIDVGDTVRLKWSIILAEDDKALGFSYKGTYLVTGVITDEYQFVFLTFQGITGMYDGAKFEHTSGFSLDEVS